jgi:hypothetical protein
MNKKTADIVKTGAEISASLAFGPAGAMVTKALGSVVTPLLEHVGQRRERRAKEFVEHFMGSDFPNETAIPLLEAEMRQAPAETKDAVFDVLRALDDSLSDRVVPALALLAREYQRAGLPKDRFLIGLLRLLRELADAEYEALRALVTTVVELWPASVGDTYVIGKVVEPTNILLWLPPDKEVAWHPSYDSLLHRLAVVEFAAVPTGWSSLKPRPNVYGEWKLYREPWSKMRSLLGPPSGKAGTGSTP